jgi:phenylacetate-CoA ligase
LHDLDTWAALVARSIRAAGGRAGDIVQVSYGYGLFTGGLGAHYGAERLGCTVIPMSGGNTEKQVQLICDLRPDIIMVTPSYLLVIAEELHRQGIDPRATSLRIGILGAEPWGEAMRSQIEAAMQIDATDIYGLSEVMGPGVASECIETKDGPVIWEDHFYPEIIDPQSTAMLPDGDLGELVLTSLTKEALPIIRYRTRDLTRLLPPTARSMRRIQKIIGRSDDMLIIRGVNVYPSQIETELLQIRHFAPHYLLEVDRAGNLDTLTVHVELAVGTSGAGGLAAAAQLEKLIKSHVGISVAVKTGRCGSITRSRGKAQHVIDKRKRE